MKNGFGMTLAVLGMVLVGIILLLLVTAWL